MAKCTGVPDISKSFDLHSSMGLAEDNMVLLNPLVNCHFSILHGHLEGQYTPFSDKSARLMRAWFAQEMDQSSSGDNSTRILPNIT
jgi:hypothetical protein